MRHFLCFLLLCLLGKITFAQSSQFQVVGTSLNSAKNSNVRLLYSVGQLTVKPIKGDLYSLVQGPVVATTEPLSLAVTSSSLEPSASLKVYPNPVLSVLTIEYPNALHICILDMVGTPVITQPLVDKNIYVGHLPAGVYIIQLVEENGKTITLKLSKL